MRNEQLLALCKEALENLANDCPGLQLATIATRDGFELVSVSKGVQTAKIAVMSGTMHALGDSIVTESHLRTCHNVIIEAEAGKVVILAVPELQEHLVLTGVAGTGTNLGMLLRQCKNCCEEIASRALGRGVTM